MLTGILITLIIITAFGFALRLGRDGGLIAHTPYNNHHNDAPGARDESFI